jgi:hypothetical protein
LLSGKFDGIGPSIIEQARDQNINFTFEQLFGSAHHLSA